MPGVYVIQEETRAIDPMDSHLDPKGAVVLCVGQHVLAPVGMRREDLEEAEAKGVDFLGRAVFCLAFDARAYVDLVVLNGSLIREIPWDKMPEVHPDPSGWTASNGETSFSAGAIEDAVAGYAEAAGFEPGMLLYNVQLLRLLTTLGLSLRPYPDMGFGVYKDDQKLGYGRTFSEAIVSAGTVVSDNIRVSKGWSEKGPSSGIQ